MAVGLNNQQVNLEMYKKIQQIKPVSTSSAQKTQTPEQKAMSKNGSIFSLENSLSMVSSNSKTTQKTVNNKHHDPFPSNNNLTNGTTNSKSNKSLENSLNINKNNAKSKISDVKSQGEKIKSQTEESKEYSATAQNNAKISEKMSVQAQKDQKDIKKQQKNFEKQLKREQTEYKKDQKELEKTIKDADRNSKEIESIQSQIKMLQESNNFDENGFNKSVYSLTLAGENENKSGIPKKSGNAGDNASELESLEAQLESKLSIGEQYGAKIKTLNMRCLHSLSNMNRTQNAFYQNQLRMQESMKASEAENNDFLHFANEAEKYSTLVQQGGQALQLVGTGLIAAGNALAGSTLGIASSLATALIVTGEWAEKIGYTAKTVGEYGVCTANVAKTAANVADGNWAAALQSSACAIQAGSAAIKSTKGFEAEMKSINTKVEDAETKLKAMKDAKEIVGKDGNGAIGDLSKKQTIKAVQADLLAGVDGENKRITDATEAYKDIKTKAETKTAQEIKATRKVLMSDFAEATEEKIKSLKKQNEDAFKDIDKLASGLSTSLNSSAAIMPQQYSTNPMGYYGRRRSNGNFVMSSRASRLVSMVANRRSRFY